MEKYIRLLTAAMNGNLPKNLGYEEKTSRGDVVNMVDELKQLSAALNARSVYRLLSLLGLAYRIAFLQNLSSARTQRGGRSIIIVFS